MSSTKGGGEPHDEGPSWAAESLPMSVRKELLELELKKLGFRRTQSPGGSMPQQQPQRTEGSSKPVADAESGEHAT